jgi:hypothetical protein
VKNGKLVAGIVVVVVVIVAGVFWVTRRGGQVVTIDLLAQLANAEKRSTWKAGGEKPFTVTDVTIGGQTKKAVFAPPFSRISWTVEVPRRGALETSFALQPDAWTKETDGVQFRFGVSDGRTYEEYLKEFANPKKRERDRRWFSATIDLSAYEGQTVKIVLSTDPGPSRRAKSTAKDDLAVWGDPKITSR